MAEGFPVYDEYSSDPMNPQGGLPMEESGFDPSLFDTTQLETMLSEQPQETPEEQGLPLFVEADQALQDFLASPAEKTSRIPSIKEQPIVKRKPEQPERLMTVQELQNAKTALGKRTAGEVLKDATRDFGSVVPFVAPIKEAVEQGRYNAAYQRLQANAYESEEQRKEDEQYVNHLTNLRQLEAARGTTIPGQIAEAVLGNIAYIGEFAATAYGPGRAGKIAATKILGLAEKDLAEKAAAEVARRIALKVPYTKALERQVTEEMLLAAANRTVGTKLITSAGGALAQLPFFSPRIAGDLFKRMAPEVQYDEQTGAASLVPVQRDVVKEGFHAIGRQFFENWTENFGDIIFDPVTEYFSRGIARFATKGKYNSLAEAMADYSKSASAAAAGRLFLRGTELMKKVRANLGQSGISGEISEEWISDVLKTTFGVDTPTDETKDMTYSEKVFRSVLAPYYKPMDYAVMAAAFSIMPLGAKAVAAMTDSELESRMKENISKIETFVANSRQYVIDDGTRVEAVKALLEPILNERAEKYYANNWFAKKFKWEFAPRSGTMTRLLADTFNIRELKKTYQQAVDAADGDETAGVKAVSDQLLAYQLGEVTRDAKSADLLKGLISEGTVQVVPRKSKEKAGLMGVTPEGVAATLEIPGPKYAALTQETKEALKPYLVSVVQEGAATEDLQAPSARAMKAESARTLGADTAAVQGLASEFKHKSSVTRASAADAVLRVGEALTAAGGGNNQILFAPTTRVAASKEGVLSKVHQVPEGSSVRIQGYSYKGGDVFLTPDAEARDVIHEGVHSILTLARAGKEGRAQYRDFMLKLRSALSSAYATLPRVNITSEQRMNARKVIEVEKALQGDTDLADEIVTIIGARFFGQHTEISNAVWAKSWVAKVEGVYNYLRAAKLGFEGDLADAFRVGLGKTPFDILNQKRTFQREAKEAIREEVIKQAGIASSVLEKPKEAAPAEKPKEAAPVEKPKEAAPAEKPKEAALVEKPKETLVEKPKEVAPAKPAPAKPAPVQAKPAPQKVPVPPVEAELFDPDAETFKAAMENLDKIGREMDTKEPPAPKAFSVTEEYAPSNEAVTPNEEADQSEDPFIDEGVRYDTVTNRFLKLLGMELKADNVRLAYDMVQGSGEKLELALVDDDSFKAWLASPSENGDEKRFKMWIQKWSKLPSVKDPRGDIQSVYAYFSRIRLLNVYTHVTDKKGKVTRTISAGADESVQRRYGKSVNARFQALTSVSGTPESRAKYAKLLNDITQFHYQASSALLKEGPTLFDYSKAPRLAPFLSKMSGLDELWMKELEDLIWGTEVPQSVRDAFYFHAYDFKTSKERWRKAVIDSEWYKGQSELVQRQITWVAKTAKELQYQIAKYRGENGSQPPPVRLRKILKAWMLDNIQLTSHDEDTGEALRDENEELIKALGYQPSRLTMFLRDNVEHERLKPLRYLDATGKSNNNAIPASAAVIILVDQEKMKVMRFAGVTVKESKVKAVNAAEMSREDLAKSEAHFWETGKDNYWMWLGPFGDKKGMLFVEVPKKLEASKVALYKETWAKLVNSRDSKLTPEQKKAEASTFMLDPAYLDRLSEFEKNVQVNRTLLHQKVLGPYEQFKDAAELEKRASPMLTGGVAGIRNLMQNPAASRTGTLSAEQEAAKKQMKGKLRFLVVDDPARWMFDQLQKDQGRELHPLTDGFGLMLEEFADRAQKAWGSVLTKKDTFDKLTTAKTLVNNIQFDARTLVKYNFGTLSKELAQVRGSLYGELKAWIDAYNKTATVPIDAIVFKSAVKAARGVTPVSLFQHNTGDNSISMKTGIPVQEGNWIDIPTESLLWVLDVRSKQEAEGNNIPTQRGPDLMDNYEVAEHGAAVQRVNQRKVLQQLETSPHPTLFPPDKLFKDASLAWQKNLVEGKTKPDVLTEEAWFNGSRKLLFGDMRPTREQTHPVEGPSLMMREEDLPSSWPVALVDETKRTWRRLTQKEINSGVEGQRIRLSRVNADVRNNKGTGRLYRFGEEERASGRVFRKIASGNRFDRETLEGYIRSAIREDHKAGKRIRYLDLVALDQNSMTPQGALDFTKVESWNLLWHEFESFQNSDGKTLYYAPGELYFYDRIPGENPHSHSVGRLQHRMDNGMIMAPEADAYFAGVDYDADARYTGLMYQDPYDPNVFETLSDIHMMMEAQQLFGDPKLFLRFKHLTDPKTAYSGIIDERVKERKAELLKAVTEENFDFLKGVGFSSPEGARTARQIQQNGKGGLGISAATSHTLSTMIWQGVALKKGALPLEQMFSIGGKEFKLDFDFVKSPENIEQRQKDYPAYKNYISRILQLFADDPKLQRIRYLNIDQMTCSLATAAVYGKKGLTEATMEGYLDTVARLLGSKAAEIYRQEKQKTLTIEGKIKGVSRDINFYRIKEEADMVGEKGTAEAIEALDQIAYGIMEIGTLARAMASSQQPNLVAEHAFKTEQINKTLKGKSNKQVFDTTPMAQGNITALSMTLVNAANNYLYGKVLRNTKIGRKLLELILLRQKETYKERAIARQMKLPDTPVLTISMAQRNNIDKRMRQILTLTALRKMLPPRFEATRGKGIGALGTVAKEVREIVAANEVSGNPNTFLSNLASTDKVRALDTYEFSDPTQEDIAAIQDSFDQLPQETQVKFALYAFYAYGMDSSFRRGSFQGFIGPKFHEKLNPVLLREQKIWDTLMYPEATLQKMIQYLIHESLDNLADESEMDEEPGLKSKAIYTDVFYPELLHLRTQEPEQPSTGTDKAIIENGLAEKAPASVEEQAKASAEDREGVLVPPTPAPRETVERGKMFTIADAISDEQLSVWVAFTMAKRVNKDERESVRKVVLRRFQLADPQDDAALVAIAEWAVRRFARIPRAESYSEEIRDRVADALRRIHQRPEDVGKYSVIAMDDAFSGLTVGNFANDKVLHRMFVDDTNEMRRNHAVALDKASRLQEAIKKLLAKSKSKISYEELASALTVIAENPNSSSWESVHIFNSSRREPGSDKAIPVWIDKNGVEKKAPTVASVVKDFRSAELMAIVDSYKKIIEDLRIMANKTMSDFTEDPGDDYIRKLRDYVMHGFLQSKLLEDVTQEVRESLLQDKFGPRYDKDSKTKKEAEDYQETPEFKRKLRTEVDSEMKERASRRETIREESGRAKAREFDTYEEAFTRMGLVPITLELPKLVSSWERSVSSVIRLKKMLTVLASTVDVHGIPAAVPIKSGTDLAYGKDTAISKRIGWAALNNVINLARKLGVSGVLLVNRDEDPWKQIQRIVDEKITKKGMMDAGYVWQDAPMLNMQGMWVQEGAPDKLLRFVTSRGLKDLAKGHPWVYKILQGLQYFNQFGKFLELSLSFFHHLAITEGYLAAMGMKPYLPWNWFNKNANFNVTGIGSLFKQLWSGKLSDKTDAMIDSWSRSGLVINIESPEFDENSFDNALDSIIKVAGKTWVTRGLVGGPVRLVKAMKTANDKLLWRVWQPTLKLQVAERWLTEMKDDPRFNPEREDEARKEIAAKVNDMFGGQVWERFLWANPRNRALMQMMVFAPDWTMSAIQATGLPDFVQKELGVSIPGLSRLDPGTGYGTNRMLTAYWPTFILMVLTGIPAVIQAAIYKAFGGDPDKGDKVWPWENEKGMQTYVDFTPFQRWKEEHFTGKQVSATRERRSYWRWGKQGWELVGWVADPRKTALSKSSVAVKTAMEQLFNTNSAGWEMPWAKDESSGLFMDTRTFSLLEKFMPMVVSAGFKNRPATLFAPARFGMSEVTAIKETARILEELANRDSLEVMRSRPAMMRVLRTYAGDILDAAEVNGYSRKEIFDRAVSTSRTRFYQELWKELNHTNPDEDAIRETLASLRRLGTTSKMLQSSLEDRAKRAQMQLPGEVRSKLITILNNPTIQTEVPPNEQIIR